MKFSTFIRDKLIFIMGQLCIILLVAFMLTAFKAGIFAVIFVCGIIIMVAAFSLWADYFRRNRYYKNMHSAFEALDQKQYLISVLDNPDFADAEIMYDVLRQTEKAMNDEIAHYRLENEEYKEYIETWIHEVKIPISCINLICENNKSSVTAAICDETSKIEGYVEQALYYARSTNLEKDYSIRTISLNKTIKNVLKKYSKELIACKSELKIQNPEYTVFTDPKWIEFIIGQVVSNSIKYRKENLKITFSAEEKNNNIILSINDNGIGIPQRDIKRVTEKGFTGENGRKFAKSTGIGLYLCKQLCSKMYLGFEIASTEGNGTTVKIVFPKDKLTMLAD